MVLSESCLAKLLIVLEGITKEALLLLQFSNLVHHEARDLVGAFHLGQTLDKFLQI